MSLRTVRRSLASIGGKRGLAIAASLACIQLWPTTLAKASEPDPSSIYSSCYPSTYTYYYAPYCYAQWDASPYDSSDRMYFYFGISSTTVGTNCWQVHDAANGSLTGGFHTQAADTTSDSFFPWDANDDPLPEYQDNASYEMGIQAYGNRGTSNISWIGIVQNT